MYDYLYVKRRRRKKIAAFVSLFTAMGITALVIVSFLGRQVGTFSVTLANTSVKLSLSEKQSFADATSYLRLDKLYNFQEYHYGDLPKDSILDNEDTPYLDNNALGKNDKGEIDCMYYLKYTFYVKNTGVTPARYNLSINLTDRSKASDETDRMLDDTVRIRVYQNDASSEEHEYRTFAKEAAGNNFLKNGKETRREFIGYNSIGDYESDEHPLAETFYNPSTICKYTVSNFRKDDIKRYTIVIWLEGEDPQSNDTDEAPVGAKLKLGVDIKAYEEV